jgi:hypothetical protein
VEKCTSVRRDQKTTRERRHPTRLHLIIALEVGAGRGREERRRVVIVLEAQGRGGRC